MNRRTSLAAAAALSAVLLAGGTTAAVAAGAPAKTGLERLPSEVAASAPAGTSAASEIGAASVRLSGADRYATAADVSSFGWGEEDALVVYLASGESFPDALSIGASTGGAGPLLLTRRDSLPQVTADELARLRPCAVVVVGGTAAVSDAVAAQADRYADPSGCEG